MIMRIVLPSATSWQLQHSTQPRFT